MAKYQDIEDEMLKQLHDDNTEELCLVINAVNERHDKALNPDTIESEILMNDKMNKQLFVEQEEEQKNTPVMDDVDNNADHKSGYARSRTASVPLRSSSVHSRKVTEYVRTKHKCVCDSRLLLINDNKLYNGSRARCDICHTIIDIADNFYHCEDNESEVHVHGFDVCTECVLDDTQLDSQRRLSHSAIRNYRRRSVTNASTAMTNIERRSNELKNPEILRKRKSACCSRRSRQVSRKYRASKMSSSSSEGYEKMVQKRRTSRKDKKVRQSNSLSRNSHENEIRNRRSLRKTKNLNSKRTSKRYGRRSEKERRNIINNEENRNSSSFGLGLLARNTAKEELLQNSRENVYSMHLENLHKDRDMLEKSTVKQAKRIELLQQKLQLVTKSEMDTKTTLKAVKNQVSQLISKNEEINRELKKEIHRNRKIQPESQWKLLCTLYASVKQLQKRQKMKTKQLNDVMNNAKKMEELVSNVYHVFSTKFEQTQIRMKIMEKRMNKSTNDKNANMNSPMDNMISSENTDQNSSRSTFEDEALVNIERDLKGLREEMNHYIPSSTTTSGTSSLMGSAEMEEFLPSILAQYN